MRHLVKLCGITSPDSLHVLNELQPDYVGFICLTSSKRYISPTQIAAMPIHPTIKKVGVFVNAPIEEVISVVNIAQLDVIQIHGDEKVDYYQALAQKINKPLIRVVRINEKYRFNETMVKDFLPFIHAILIDKLSDGVYGGSGESFSWELLPPFIQFAQKHNCPLIVAGGLDPNNVEALITQYAISGVDVSSGIETSGQKDLVKMRQFVERVRKFGN